MKWEDDLKAAMAALADDPGKALDLLEKTVEAAPEEAKDALNNAIKAIKGKDSKQAQGYILQALQAKKPKGKVPYGYAPPAKGADKYPAPKDKYGYYKKPEAKAEDKYPVPKGKKDKYGYYQKPEAKAEDKYPIPKDKKDKYGYYQKPVKGRAVKAPPCPKKAEECLLPKPLRLFNAAAWAFGEVPEWIQVIPGPGQWDHPKYGKITITENDLREFQRNFAAEVYQEHIPIDAEHETKLAGACGWYKDVKLRGPHGEPGLWAKVEWTERGKALLEEERYRYFSPEWYDRWTDPATGKEYRNVLIGGALTTRPFFKDKDLIPLVASEGYLWAVERGADGEGERWCELGEG
jgi:hypothetical protein